MFSTILVGTDGSETAAAAVALATDLAKLHGAQLHLVTAFKLSSGVGGGTGDVAGGAPLSGDGLSTLAAEQLVERAAKEIAVPTITHTASGSPAQVILSVASEIGADLIVVGSKGMQGARRVIGSVPNSVAHGSSCHVLIAKTH